VTTDDIEPGTYYEDPDPTHLATIRSEGLNYIGKSFILDDRNSSDRGQHARFIRKVFDQPQTTEAVIETDRFVIRQSTGGRIQIQLLVAREANRIKELWIQRVPKPGSRTKITDLVNFKRKDAEAFVGLLKLLDFLPIEGPGTRSLDDDLLSELLRDPGSIAALYKRDRAAFVDAVEEDVDSHDIIALAHRRKQVATFRKLLHDPVYFKECRERFDLNGDEAVWQLFFERNPWIFGLGLTGQLITSWDKDKLEQTVAGSSIAGPGKRVDAIMRTSGRIKSMVFVEIKMHDVDLVAKEAVRSGCWSPSTDVSDGVAQLQGTTYRAVKQIGERINTKYDDGTEDLSDPTYLFTPRSYLLIGSLDSMLGEKGGHDPAKNLSFEMYRSSISGLDIVTYDELLARAEALVSPMSDPH
jgi:hypothetical protein